MQRVLKLHTKEGESYYLPKRERFNEEAEKEIEQQMKEAKKAQHYKGKKVLKQDNLKTLGQEAQDPGEYSLFTKTSGKTTVTSKRTISNTGKLSQALTKKGSKANTTKKEMKSEKSHKRKVDGASSKGAHRNLGSTQNTITSNNRRYQADKAKSQVGLLLGMSLRRTSKTIGSYNDKQMKDTIVHDQDATEEMNFASPTRSEKKADDVQNDDDMQEKEVNSEEEHSYHDSEEEADEIAEHRIGDDSEYIITSDNVGGHTLGSWGTGKQGGFNQCYLTPS